MRVRLRSRAMPQPHKGLRVQVTARVAPLVAADAQRSADRAGLTLSDWITKAIKAQLYTERQAR